MKSTTIAVLVFCLSTTEFSLAQSASELNPNKLSEDEYTVSNKAEIDKATADKRTDILFFRMHGSSVSLQMYCLKQIGTLPSKEQATLLSKLLDDDTLLRRADTIFEGHFLPMQTTLQRTLEKMSFQLLKQPIPRFHGLLTRVEAKELSSKLSTLK